MFMRCVFLLVAAALAGVAHADVAPFDLAGPTIEARVTRGTTTLPASEVPNLAEGDRLWIKADLPPTQSAHYLLVVAFLSGSTNPPPEDWFFPCKTWKEKYKCVRNGLSVTVPEGAQQVLVFLAPETGGDFSTLVDAVRGRPGAFVRASQDLNQAELDRSRLDRYLSTISALDDTDPSQIKTVAPLLARSLAIKVNQDCLTRIPELQASCLMQDQNSLILNDGHSTSIVEALTNGPGSDLLMAVSATQQLGYGYYSPYVASVLDIAHILDSFTTAEYQYIPALATVHGDKLDLSLNTAPSFNDPKSVLVAALPAVEQPQLPPLHAVNPKQVYCASRSTLVLPVEGAPLVFSTGYAHDLTLTLTGADGKVVALPATADATQGGYVVDTSGLRKASLGQSVQASLKGYWGFDPYEGPGFLLRNVHASNWALADGDEDALIVGRQDTVHLRADSVSCVDRIMLRDPDGKELTAEWKPVGPDDVEVKLPLQDAQPGAMTLLVKQYGDTKPQTISIQGFADAAHLDGFVIHAGDSHGVLDGSRLDEVASLTTAGINFVPGELSSVHGDDQLVLTAQDAQAAAALKQGAAIPVKVTLKDGRVFHLAANVDAPRPRATLIGKSVRPSQSGTISNIRLANQGELPSDSRLTFSLRAQSPARFTRDQTVEVATTDGSFSTTLGLGNGGVRLENSRIAVVTLDPAKAFGPSAFGPLQFRVIAAGVAGDWQPLATLVRLPVLKDLTCPAAPDLACTLAGADLFLVDSVSGDAQFDHPIQVPDGFPGEVMPVPRPSNGLLYIKLSDDPAVINSVALDTRLLPPATDKPVHTATVQTTAQSGHETVFNPGVSPPATPAATVSDGSPATSASSPARPAP
ncbi:MAG: hypothetical protein ACRETM_00885 [Stenotrophobium sp.]